ncbi:MAG: two-component system sensor histidine kinase/response regulator [Lentisphaeria bacterium]
MTDAGPGIATEEQANLFKAFSAISTQTTGGEKKTGLGLAIAKSVADAHEGKIYYQHSAKAPSTFFVELPLHR